MGALSLERKPPIRHVVLDTGRMNVLDVAAVRELSTVLMQPDAEAPVVLLSGRDDAFCAGLDLATLAKGGEERQELLAAMGELLAGMYGSPTRLAIACRGHAVAAGAMLLLVADVRIGAAGRYKVGFSEPSQGMPLPALPVLLARDRLDRRHFQAATLLGRLYQPERALEAGFLDELVSGDRLDTVASERAHELAQLTHDDYAGTLSAVRGETRRQMETLLDEERRRLADLRGRRTHTTTSPDR